MSEGQLRESQAIHTCAQTQGWMQGMRKFQKRACAAGCARERGQHGVKVTSLSQQGPSRADRAWLCSTPQGSGQHPGTQTPSPKVVACVPRSPCASQGSRSCCHQHCCTLLHRLAPTGRDKDKTFCPSSSTKGLKTEHTEAAQVFWDTAGLWHLWLVPHPSAVPFTPQLATAVTCADL